MCCESLEQDKQYHESSFISCLGWDLNKKPATWSWGQPFLAEPTASMRCQGRNELGGCSRRKEPRAASAVSCWELRRCPGRRGVPGGLHGAGERVEWSPEQRRDAAEKDRVYQGPWVARLMWCGEHIQMKGVTRRLVHTPFSLFTVLAFDLRQHLTTVEFHFLY